MFGKKPEGEAVPLLPASEKDGAGAVPLGTMWLPLLPSSDEEGVKAEEGAVPAVGPTITELALKVGKGAP
jgi:hypothetical protein